MLKVALTCAVVFFWVGFAFGKGWVPVEQMIQGSPTVQAPVQPSSAEPTYSTLELNVDQYGQLAGHITLHNNSDQPLTVMATITTYDHDQTLDSLFGRADRMKPHSQQTVDVVGGPYKRYTDLAVDLSAVP